FAGTMRRLEYATLIDPFEARYGKRWAAVLFLPAMFGEGIWGGALLVALGTTLEVLLNLERTQAVLLSAVVVTSYTMLGGLWSVAYTDLVQFSFVPLGLLVALPFALAHVGGLERCVERYEERPGA